MFTERRYASVPFGSIEVICGSMFSGKTEELIRRLKRAQIAGLRTEIYKPHLDKRYAGNDVVSHNSNRIPCVAVQNAQSILLLSTQVEVLGIDEAQFFDDEIIAVVQQLAANGIRIIIAGLDMDYMGRPFGPMPHLLAIADDILKLHAICMQCGDIATFSFRKNDTAHQLELGAQEKYEPRCRKCFLTAG